jgi:ubiquitin C-terminal hydrolase
VGGGKEPPPRVGLVNGGVSCFFNSVVQALYHTDGFRRCVLEGGRAATAGDALRRGIGSAVF